MRTKADGAAFEREFKECMKEKYYVRRLPTLNTGFAGQTQPADFVVVGQHFNYVELKETAGDSFSITSMQQLPELEEFIAEKRRLKGKAVEEMQYWLIVHFIKRGVLKAIRGEGALKMSEKHMTLKYDAEELMTFYSLRELKERILL